MEQGFTLWFTGLSGAGKSTLANLAAEELRERGHRVEILDGDEVRTNLSKGLGFSKEDRDTNIRRIGYVCRLLARNGVIAISAAISPYREIRDEVRRKHDRFFEVFVRCALDKLVERDVKGLYKKALAGEIKSSPACRTHTRSRSSRNWSSIAARKPSIRAWASCSGGSKN